MKAAPESSHKRKLPSGWEHCVLEVETNLAGDRTRRHVVRAAERGEEVVKRHFVGQIDDGQTGAPPVSITMEHIVVASR
jgi:hypothetical protein